MAAYLLGRLVDDREIEEKELGRLRRANDVLQQSREALHRGRGNVITDIEATQGDSARTVVAARVVRNKQKLDALPLHRAAFAQIGGAGNCGEHSAVAVHKLAAHLSDGEEAHGLRNPDPNVDHSWAELRTQGSEQPTIVLDAWGEGPALHAEDGAYSSSDIPASLRESVFSYDTMTAPLALDQMASFHAEQANRLGSYIDQVRARLEANGFKPKKVFSPTPVIDAAFASRVRKKMESANDLTLFRLNLPVLSNPDLRNDLLATGVLRQLDASVKVATAAARDVSIAASNLSRAPQNPPRAPAALIAEAGLPAPQTLDLFPRNPIRADTEAESSSSRRSPDDEPSERRVRQRR